MTFEEIKFSTRLKMPASTIFDEDLIKILIKTGYSTALQKSKAFNS
jgi:hypothetical protein